MKTKVVSRRAGSRYALHVIKEEKEECNGGGGHQQEECSKCEKPRIKSATAGALRPSNDILVNAKPIEVNKKFEFTFGEQSITTKLGLLSYLFHLIIESNSIFRQIDAEIVKYAKETEVVATTTSGSSVDETRAFIKKCLSRNKQIYQQARGELRLINEQKMNKLIGLENNNKENERRPVSGGSIDLDSIQSELVARIKDLKLKLVTLTTSSGEFKTVAPCDCDNQLTLLN
jgi:hypothetical protein